MTKFEKICVIGLGYIGLPTAAVFAARKIQVQGIDVNQSTVDTINRGEIHIVEPDLDIAVRSVVTEGYLHASVTVSPAQAFIVAVPTPFKGTDHAPDLSYIQAAALAIAPVLETGNLVILESTSPVGATEKMAAWLQEARPDLTFPQSRGEASDIRIAHCPERVLPGKIMQELIANDRVIGGLTLACSNAAAALYKTFVQGQCIVTNARTAEMAKLTENSFRDVNIAFANELSMICKELEIDVWELISLANRHPRVNILQPGPGVGGHCIAVDPWFIVSSTPALAQLIRTAREVNNSKPQWVLAEIADALQKFIASQGAKKAADVRVALYGLSFKPDVDDLRESPALAIAQQAVATLQGQFVVVEPHVNTVPDALDGTPLVTAQVAQDTADIHVFLVGHSQFRTHHDALKNASAPLLDICGMAK